MSPLAHSTPPEDGLSPDRPFPTAGEPPEPEKFPDVRLPAAPPPMLAAWCGALPHPEQVEQATPDQVETPCTGCAHALTPDPDPAEHTGAPEAPDPDDHPAPGEWDPNAEPLVAGVLYRQWGWPATLRRDRVWLPLTGTAVALFVPAALAERVVPILIQRHCPPLVIIHPATPEHRVLLGTEPYPVPLDYPPGVRRITTQILLPPTTTPHGPLRWVHPPRPDALRLTREIDLCAAIQTVLPGSGGGGW